MHGFPVWSSFGAAILLAVACGGSSDEPDREPPPTELTPEAGSGGSGGAAPQKDADTEAETGIPPAVGDASLDTAQTAQDAPPPEPVPSTFTVSGALKVGGTLFVDTDTNDPNNGIAPNDSFAQAQRIDNPSTGGGYIGVAQGYDDPADYYRVDLAAGQAVTLYIASPNDSSPVPDLDLFVYDAAQNQVAESRGTGPVELVSAPATGSFYVKVERYSNGDLGLYTLTVGQRAGAAAVADASRDRLDQSWPAVAGEALVRLAPPARGRSSDADIERRLGVRFLSRGHNVLGYRRVRLGTPNRVREHTSATTTDAIKTLRRRPGVLSVSPNYIRQPAATPPNDPLYSSQWHYPQVNVIEAWDHSTGAGVLVAVLDTGVKASHPDFTNSDSTSQLEGGYDMVSSLTFAADGNGRDSNPDDPGDRRFLTGSSWHGTHTAGTVAAATNNGLGCAGVAPGAKVMPVRVLGVGGGLDDDIIQGILYAAGLDNDTGQLPARRADIINLSFAGPGTNSLIADAVAAARASGVIVIASAGNSADDAAFYSPGGEPGVVTVGAVDLSKERAFYSNYGSAIDLVGPGGDESEDANFDGLADGVLSLVYDASTSTLYTPYQGTSMAAPHVSGIAALMKSAYPEMTPELFDNLIAGRLTGVGRITEDLGVAGADSQFGHGLINASLAVVAARQAAAGLPVQEPAVGVSVQTLDFGPASNSIGFDVRNVGGGTLLVSSVAVNQPWLSVTPGDVGLNTATVDRVGLADGVYAASIVIETNGGSVTLPVRLAVGTSSAVGGDVGSIYVLLVEPETFETLYQFTARVEVGYAFSFADTPAGQYVLLAGSDYDDNGIIDDDGETFGAYPLSADPQRVDVSSDVSGLDFAVQHLFNLQPASMGAELGARRGIRRLW